MPRSRPAVIAALLALSGTTLAACSGGGAKPAANTVSPSASPSASASVHPAAATCPLTGLAPAKGQSLHRVALAVKIDNIDLARPQSGINNADVVIEETVEGGLTRLMAIFQCGGAGVIGPVRSARTSDGDLLQLLHGAIFGYSGSNGRVGAQMAATSHAVLLSYDANGGLYYRSSSRAAPHNVYTSTGRLVQAGLARDHKLKAPHPIFSYSPKAGRGKAVHHLALQWSGYTTAAWDWAKGAWQRTQNGTPDVLADHHRVTAANVVVMSIATKFIGLHDVLGNASPDDVVTGSGKVWVLRDGHVIKGTWSRPRAAKPMVLKDKSGHVIALHPGRTWIELLPRPRVPHLS